MEGLASNFPLVPDFENDLNVHAHPSKPRLGTHRVNHVGKAGLPFVDGGAIGSGELLAESR